MILSDRLWRTRFAADPAIVGRKITLDNNPYTVIGVMPASFEDVLAPAAELWSPLQYNPALPLDGREWGHHLQMIGRLRPGVSRQQAQSESTVILHALGQEYAKGYDNSGGASQAMLVYRLQDDITRDVKPALLAIMGGVVLVLLIACVNVTNLLLARGAQRRSEFAMRVALGAGRARLLQQLLTESLLLAMVGGVLGIALAQARSSRAGRVESCRSAAGRRDPTSTARCSSSRLRSRLLVGLVVGLMPALQAARSDPQSGLQQELAHHDRQAAIHAARAGDLRDGDCTGAAGECGPAAAQYSAAVRDPAGLHASHLLTMQVQDYGQRPDDEARRGSRALL